MVTVYNIPKFADICEQCDGTFIGLSRSTKWCPYCGAKHEGTDADLVFNFEEDTVTAVPIEN